MAEEKGEILTVHFTNFVKIKLFMEINLTVTTSLISFPSARLPRMAKTTIPAKTEVRELQMPTMKASLWQLLVNLL